MDLSTTITSEKPQFKLGKLEFLMQKPLLVGASVSGDHSANSPGKRLALQYTKRENIKTIAQNGVGSFKILQSLREEDVMDRTIIIAIDLFFWDSTLNEVESSLEKLNQLTQMAKKYQVPLIIGDVPELIPGWQPQRKILNAAIQAHCSRMNYCYHISLDDILLNVMRHGYIVSAGRKYSLGELVPDGLHLNAVGSEIIAERLKLFIENNL